MPGKNLPDPELESDVVDAEHEVIVSGLSAVLAPLHANPITCSAALYACADLVAAILLHVEALAADRAAAVQRCREAFELRLNEMVGNRNLRREVHRQRKRPR